MAMTSVGSEDVVQLLLSLMTSARPFEILAAAAAYSAVLMVYLQVGSNNSATA